MNKMYKSKREEGFTIIEVLIVLAIAGLIMLIVFLAVPTLQRNSRNTQRTNDASLVTAAVSDCMNNRNALVASCDSLAELKSNGGLDDSKLKQLTTVNVGAAAPAAPGDGVVNTLNVGFVAKCMADGSGVETGTLRQASVLYRAENTSTGAVRCIDV